MKAAFGVDSMPETAENVAAEYKVVARRPGPHGAGAARPRRSRRRRAASSTARSCRSRSRRRKASRSSSRATSIRARPRSRRWPSSRAWSSPTARSRAGNASGVNDGACALIVASEAAAKRHGLTPRARVVGVAVAGVAPRVMGIGPAPATQKLLERTGVTLAAIDVIELNEAFAAQGLAVLRQLGIADDDPRVNPNGGAIALGHPLGMSGARLVTTAVNQLQRTRGRYGAGDDVHRRRAGDRAAARARLSGAQRQRIERRCCAARTRARAAWRARRERATGRQADGEGGGEAQQGDERRRHVSAPGQAAGRTASSVPTPACLHDARHLSRHTSAP